MNIIGHQRNVGSRIISESTVSKNKALFLTNKDTHLNSYHNNKALKPNKTGCQPLRANNYSKQRLHKLKCVRCSLHSKHSFTLTLHPCAEWKKLLYSYNGGRKKTVTTDCPEDVAVKSKQVQIVFDVWMSALDIWQVVDNPGFSSSNAVNPQDWVT